MGRDSSAAPRMPATPGLGRVLGFGLPLVVSAAVGVAALLRHDHATRVDAGYRHVATQVLGVERELRRELTYQERGMHGVGSDAAQYAALAPERAQGLLEARIRGVLARNPDFVDMRVVGTAALSPALANARSGRGDGDGLRIAPPQQVREADGGTAWVLPMAVPVPGDDGEGRWVVSHYRVDRLAWLVQGLDLGRDGMANVIHRDGTMVLRSSQQAQHVGRDVRATELMRRAAVAPVGAFDQPSPLDGGQRLIAYRVMADAPLVVAVSRARADVLAGWSRFATSVVTLATLLCGLWLALLWIALRSRTRQYVLNASLAETRRIAGIGDWTWWPDRRETQWSPEVWRMFGLEPRATPMSDDELLEYVHPQDRERLRTTTAHSAAGGTGGDLEYRIVRPDGEVRTVYSRGEWQHGPRAERVMRGTQQDITELADTRAHLRAAQRQYRALFDVNPLPAYVFDRESLRFLAVNDAMVRTYGYSREELLGGMTLRDIRPASEHAALADATARDDDSALQGSVWTHQHRDGTPLRMAMHTRNIAFDGRPARLSLAQDVTEAERMRERMALIARATTDAIYDYDIVGGHIWWSETFYKVFDHPRTLDMDGLGGWKSLVHPDDLPGVLESLDRVLASADLEWEQSYRFRRGDGRYADVFERGLIVRDAAGRATRMVGGLLDVSERERSRADLRLLKRAVEASDNGILIADARQPDLPVVYVNPAFQEMTGYSVEEVMGGNCRFLQRDDRDQPGIVSIRNAIAEGRETRVLLRNYRKDGRLFWNDFHLAPVRDDAGVLTHYVGIQNDVTDRQNYEEQLAYRATHDELTGLPNRQLLLDRLQQGLLNAERYGRGVGVVFIDLDDFKLINDSLGHSAGDAALMGVAARLKQAVRDTDTVGRFGGDEFVVVLTEQTDEAGMRQVVDRIAAALVAPLSIGGVAHVLTPSIGYCAHPEAGRTAEQLLMHADVAMYEAKRQGRNRAVAYRAEFEDAVSQRLQLVARIREGLERREFELAFQPVFDAGDRIVAVEALARWRHPERGLLQPAHFIAVCEESGLIVELGRHVLEEAARHHRLLREAGFGHLRVAVNVSPAQFNAGLYDTVSTVIDTHGLPRGALELEITESLVMDNPEGAIETMDRLSRRGVCIAIDDFGTGYSSLAYLKRLPIDRLKIDRSFVRDLPDDGDDAAICELVIGMAHTLQLATVAEGVESADQRDWLRAHGCQELQGYHLAMPMPFDELLTTLHDKAAALHVTP